MQHYPTGSGLYSQSQPTFSVNARAQQAPVTAATTSTSKLINSKQSQAMTALAVILVIGSVATLVALGLTGVLSGGGANEADAFQNSGNLLPVPQVDPNDPYYELAQMNELTSTTGLYGCSNVPIRAGLNSVLYHEMLGTTADLKSAQGDRCPAGAVRYTITECDLLQAMQLGDPDIASKSYVRDVIRPLHPHIVRAMEMYDINCSPHRMAAWLAQVQHETASLTSMYQSIDGGAGAIHLVPTNFNYAIEAIPELRAAYDAEIEGDLPLVELQAAGSDFQQSQIAEATGRSGKISVATGRSGMNDIGDTPVERAAELIARPEFAFLVAGWWFRDGSRIVLGPGQGCSDLRLDSDAGLVDDRAQGFYRVSACIFGGATDAGLDQRVAYYEGINEWAQANWSCQTAECRDEAASVAAVGQPVVVVGRV